LSIPLAPLTWKVDSAEYCNERAAATQQTGFSFVAQCRSWLPNKIGGIFWFGVDDAASSVYCPIYASSTKVPCSMAVGNGDMMTWSATSAFWAFNQVSNLAYTRYSYIHPEIEAKQQTLENKYIAYTPAIDQAALSLMKSDTALAVNFLTDYSVNTADRLFLIGTSFIISCLCVIWMETLKPAAMYPRVINITPRLLNNQDITIHGNARW
jgi:dipeptidase